MEDCRRTQSSGQSAATFGGIDDYRLGPQHAPMMQRAFRSGARKKEQKALVLKYCPRQTGACSILGQIRILSISSFAEGPATWRTPICRR
jgi:hypothetical protein